MISRRAGSPPAARRSPRSVAPRPAGPGRRCARWPSELLDEIDRRPVPVSADEPDDLDVDPGRPGPASRRAGTSADRRPDARRLARPGRRVPARQAGREGPARRASGRSSKPPAAGRSRGYFTAVGLPDDVAARWPWNQASRPTSLVENIDGMPEDDDLNYPLIALSLLETARARASPPTTSRRRGWTASGRPGLHRRTGRLSQPARSASTRRRPRGTATRSGSGSAPRSAPTSTAGRIPGGPTVAADAGVRGCSGQPRPQRRVRRAVRRRARRRRDGASPTWTRCSTPGSPWCRRGSRFAEAVRFARDAAAAETDWERVVDAIEARYGDLHWVHVLNNAALLTAALAHAEGDFVRLDLPRSSSGGWDTDSSGATVGAVAGALCGAQALPAEWTAPLHNRLATTVPGLRRRRRRRLRRTRRADR